MLGYMGLSPRGRFVGTAMAILLVTGCEASKPRERPAERSAMQNATVLRPAARARTTTVAAPWQVPTPAATPPLAMRAPAIPAVLAAPLLELLQGASAPATSRAAALVTERDPSSGSPEARVTAVLFGDFQCPFTSRTVVSFEALRDRYSDDQLRIVWKNYPLPFHDQARPAAAAAEAVRLLGGSPAFWAFAKLLARSPRDLSQARLETWAAASGVAAATYQWLTGEGLGEVSAKIDEDVRLADATGVRSTPHVFIGDQEIRGDLPVAELAAAIDGQLAAADDPAP